MKGFFNTYNILAATAAALAQGVPLDEIGQALRSYTPALGRMEEFILGGHSCTLVLIKNPAGVNEVLKTVLGSRRQKSLVIAINDLAADGRDVSWLWDADFARLVDPMVKKIICAGRRAADFAVCLKYAGIEPDKLVLEPERQASLKLLAEEPVDELYVLATYTNLYDYARLLKRLGRAAEHHADQSVSSLS
jgi:UDP-N-acetylmuramyl tripeptide synthase